MFTGFLSPLFLLFLCSLILGGFVHNNSSTEGVYSARFLAVILPLVSFAWALFACWFLYFREWAFLERWKASRPLLMIGCALSGCALILSGLLSSQVHQRGPDSLIWLGAEGAVFLVAFSWLWRRRESTPIEQPTEPQP